MGEVAAAAYFTDPDGDGLTFGASSSRPRVAAVSVSGSRLTVTPRRPGTTMITVTATDTRGSNQTATQTFTVTVVQPFTDDPLVPGVTAIKAVHFTELMDRIDSVRVDDGLRAYPWGSVGPFAGLRRPAPRYPRCLRARRSVEVRPGGVLRIRISGLERVLGHRPGQPRPRRPRRGGAPRRQVFGVGRPRRLFRRALTVEPLRDR